MEHWTRRDGDSHVSQAIPSDSQDNERHEHRRRASEPAEPDLGIDFGNFDIQPPSLIAEEQGSTHTTTEEHLLSQPSATNIAHRERLHRPIHAGWTPKYLHRTTFIVFAIIFTSILIALTVLYSYSQRNQGVSTADPNLHYLWTYGPTAGE